MKLLFCLLSPVSCLLALAAVQGVVTNTTTGQPQSSVMVVLMQPGAQGMQTLGTARTAEDGGFRIDKDIPPGPGLVQASYKGATYTLMIVPGSPTTGLRVSVFDTTTDLKVARVKQHIYLVEPTPQKLDITETFLVQNDSKTTFADPAKGSIQVFVPANAFEKDLQATVNFTGSMPIRRPLEKTAQDGVYKIAYPVKPGETRFDISYSLPASDKWASKDMRPEAPARVVSAAAVRLSGTGIEDLGQEPTTQAHLYEVKSPSFDIAIEGTGSLRTADASAKEDNGQPPILEQPARLYSQMGWVLGLTFGILLVGGTILFRRGQV